MPVNQWSEVREKKIRLLNPCCFLLDLVRLGRVLFGQFGSSSSRIWSEVRNITPFSLLSRIFSTPSITRFWSVLIKSMFSNHGCSYRGLKILTFRLHHRTIKLKSLETKPKYNFKKLPNCFQCLRFKLKNHRLRLCFFPSSVTVGEFFKKPFLLISWYALGQKFYGNILTCHLPNNFLTGNWKFSITNFCVHDFFICMISSCEIHFCLSLTQHRTIYYGG